MHFIIYLNPVPLFHIFAKASDIPKPTLSFLSVSRHQGSLLSPAELTEIRDILFILDFSLRK